MRRAYRLRQHPDEEGDPLSRIAVRSLLVPPGIPEYLTRSRIVEAGEHELCCRARDAAGNEQPLEPQWNLGGYANNAVQRAAVIAR